MLIASKKISKDKGGRSALLTRILFGLNNFSRSVFNTKDDRTFKIGFLLKI